jgi:hypothetical protein
MVAEAAHGLGLPADTEEAVIVEAVGLDEGKGDVAGELGVVGEVDALLAAFAEEAHDLVAAVAEGGRPLGLGVRGWGLGEGRGRTADIEGRRFAVTGGEVSQRVEVLRVDAQNCFRLEARDAPVALFDRLLYLAEKAVDLLPHPLR